MRSNKRAPMVGIKYFLSEDGYKAAKSCIPLRHTKSSSKSPVIGTIQALADTGCTTMVAGLSFIRHLGLRPQDLLPVRTSIKAANRTEIVIIGAVIVEIRLNRPNSETFSKQVVYITTSADRVFLNREACEQLGLIPDQFPFATVNAVGEEENYRTCDCPVRSQPPPMPDKLPFPATEREKLEKWLLDRYASSTFNVCEHQPLPLMSGEPIRLFTDESIKPHAVHTPSPIPVHFKEEVKKQLDRDVQIGVLEKVPPNTPTTWCSRLVIATKADGSPRRTVDFQKMNEASVRQTHPTKSPYHLVMSIPQNTKKTVYDAWNGYHSVPIHKDDRHKTTFITEFGRYRYKTCLLYTSPSPRDATLSRMPSSA